MMLRALFLAALILFALPLTADDAPFVEWSRRHAVSLRSGQHAFQRLDRELRTVRLIGVGESVHETEPFGTFRLDLLEYLVKRQRVTALILESGLADGIPVNDYVHGRTSSIDYQTALPGDLGTLEHVRATVEWLRAWNAGPGRRNPVSIYGADLPGRAGSFLPALDRLEKLVEGSSEMQSAIESVRPLAEKTSSTWWRGAAQKYDALTAEEKNALTAGIDLLVERADAMKSDDAERLAWTRRIARVVQQHDTHLRLGAFHPTAPREVALAENITWLLDRVPGRERAVFWAHNAHVQREVVTGKSLPAGRFTGSGGHLGAAMGDRYFAIGTTYGGPSRQDQSPPVEGSIDGALERVGVTAFLLPLRSPKRPAEVKSWLAEERPMRFQVGYLDLPVGTAFDAIFFFDRAVAAPRAAEVKRE